MSDNDTAELNLLVSREHAENKLRDAIRLYVGRGRLYSVEQLAKGIGLPMKNGKQITKPLYDFISPRVGSPDHRPLHFGLVMSITAFLGPDFTNEWLGIASQVAFDVTDEEPDPGQLAAITSQDTADIVRMVADGDLANDDPRALIRTGTSMAANGMKLTSMGARRMRA